MTIRLWRAARVSLVLALAPALLAACTSGPAVYGRYYGYDPYWNYDRYY